MFCVVTMMRVVAYQQSEYLTHQSSECTGGLIDIHLVSYGTNINGNKNPPLKIIARVVSRPKAGSA